MALDPKAVQFNGPEELRELCRIIAGRLNSANRIAMGGSRFAFEISDMFVRLGDVFEEADDELFAQFGNEYKPATLTKTEQREKLIELLFPL